MEHVEKAAPNRVQQATASEIQAFTSAARQLHQALLSASAPAPTPEVASSASIGSAASKPQSGRVMFVSSSNSSGGGGNVYNSSSISNSDSNNNSSSFYVDGGVGRGKGGDGGIPDACLKGRDHLRQVLNDFYFSRN